MRLFLLILQGQQRHDFVSRAAGSIKSARVGRAKECLISDSEHPGFVFIMC